MDARMNARLALIAIVAAVLPAATAAQPAKDQHRARATQPAAAAPVVLASANDVRPPSATAAEGSPEPVRRPAPRVTTCRCGDPQPAEEQPDQ